MITVTDITYYDLNHIDRWKGRYYYRFLLGNLTPLIPLSFIRRGGRKLKEGLRPS